MGSKTERDFGVVPGEASEISHSNVDYEELDNALEDAIARAEDAGERNIAKRLRLMRGSLDHKTNIKFRG